ncbi:MAG: MFS transporter [Isosphaeraceae bacterium]
MHVEPIAPNSVDTTVDSGPWYRGLTRYHWFVLIVASLGWMFDTMDQQLFNLARKPAIAQLLGPDRVKEVDEYGGYATSIFMIGWAVGGLFFGVVGDRIGRAKTMLLTILVYSIFTGLSALSKGFGDFAFYRFLTGLGVGGEFAVGVSLVAEVMPDRARPFALGWLQALSAVGNMTAAVVAMILGQLERSGTVSSSGTWRAMFMVGALPAALTIPIFLKLKEPERWQKATGGSEGAKLGSIRELFGDPRWRTNALAGMLWACAGVIGVWGIGFFSFDLFRSVFTASFKAMGLSDAETAGRVTLWVGIQSLMQNLGAFFGILAFSKFTQSRGRKPAFAVALVLAMAATAFTFRYLNSLSDVFWMIPLMGFCQLSLFGGYAIYFPELFPTRLRSTGTSFCYNVGRLVAALGPLSLGLLTSRVFNGYANPWPLRYAGMTMCSCLLVGFIALIFLPETKGKPLPE